MKRVFTKPGSEYEVSTTLPPDKDLDALLARFADALKKPEFPEIPDFRPKKPGPVSEEIGREQIRAMCKRWKENDPREKLYQNAVAAWEKAEQEYEPTPEEADAERQLWEFVNANP